MGMANCDKCVHYAVCVRLGKPSLYGINKELGCDRYFELVRCKDCKQFVPFVEPYNKAGQCRKMVGLIGEDGFCSYGERIEE